MAYDEFKGGVNEVAGKVQSKVGEATGDHEMQADGTVRNLAGQAQSLYGDLKSGVSDVADGIVDMASQRLGPDNGRRFRTRCRNIRSWRWLSPLPPVSSCRR
ncbi:CsbD family protein [Beijerinckia sp. L45]|uniref:CsbD family protein n=1 Tax=Beijerinckia sp. L45 TaxID=1641855 RepID=UPI00131ABB66|nr:CsbD family protein [Beijerinckia sp. L45]